ncbi:hypothetical protein DNTS_006058 [Danionella cerebrum]|uniref:Uncharacterized protein n=1 Tax=Danionella cerebrum TaxID=2873325 RepID=A0A553NL94_9TELE|nr:hypothetical protein DNTS_006058 [Danionella translucida]
MEPLTEEYKEDYRGGISHHAAEDDDDPESVPSEGAASRTLEKFTVRPEYRGEGNVNAAGDVTPTEAAHMRLRGRADNHSNTTTLPSVHTGYFPMVKREQTLPEQIGMLRVHVRIVEC